jgi:hypothetical protein
MTIIFLFMQCIIQMMAENLKCVQEAFVPRKWMRCAHSDRFILIISFELEMNKCIRPTNIQIASKPPLIL